MNIKRTLSFIAAICGVCGITSSAAAYTQCHPSGWDSTSWTATQSHICEIWTGGYWVTMASGDSQGWVDSIPVYPYYLYTLYVGRGVGHRAWAYGLNSGHNVITGCYASATDPNVTASDNVGCYGASYTRLFLEY